MIDNITFYIDDFTTRRNKIPEWEQYFPKPKAGRLPIPEKYTFYSRKVNRVKKKAFLTISLRYDDEEDVLRVRIKGSIRNWYYGENTKKDLKLSELKYCVKLLSIKIGVSEETLLNARVTRFENGINFFIRHEYHELSRCFINHRNFKRRVDGTSMYFDGKVNKSRNENNYNIIIYEKLCEITKKDKALNAKPEVIAARKKLILLRFEIKIKKISALAFYKKNANTVQKIISNWEKIKVELFKRFKIIRFVDLISEKKNMDDTKLNKRDLKIFEQFKATNKDNFHEEFEKFNATNTSTNRSTKLKLFIKNYEMFLDKKKDYKEMVLSAFEDKLDKL